MTTARGIARTAGRMLGAAAVTFAGAVLTAVCALSWLVKAEMIDFENVNDPHWAILIFLTFGSLALLAKGIRDLVRH